MERCRVRRSVNWERGMELGISFCLSAILFAGNFGGGYVPFALGFLAAAEPGLRSVAALFGGVLGAAAFLDFSHALRAVASALLLFTARNSFHGTKLSQKRWFLPMSTAALCLSVEFVYLLPMSAAEIADGLFSVALTALSADCCRARIQGRSEPGTAAMLLSALGVLTALCSLQTRSGFAPGRILASLLVMLLTFGHSTGTALSGALCIGFAADLTQGLSFLHTALYSLCALAMSREEQRVGAALRFTGALVLLSLPLHAEEGVMLLYEGLVSVLVFLLLPKHCLQGRREMPERTERTERKQSGSALRRSLAETAEALREVYDSLVPPVQEGEENPFLIFERSARRVCRGCSLRTVCWEREYGKTVGACNDATAAILSAGRAAARDFPTYFTDRCIRIPSFLAAVNAELNTYLLRREYRGRLSEAQLQAAGQYARLSELLYAAAEAADAPEPDAPLLEYRIGTAMRPKDGESVSGDSVTSFETERGELCLLLSDGMGCGESARRESALAVRLLERFLRSGIAAESALRTLNDALALRTELSGSFTTIDLLLLSLTDGTARLYKYGAAPSYCRRGSRVQSIGGAVLPAGLERGECAGERLTLRRGSFFVMLSDGVSDGRDGWPEHFLADWEGFDPQELSEALLRESRSHGAGQDDGTVMTLYLPRSSIKEV